MVNWTDEQVAAHERKLKAHYRAAGICSTQPKSVKRDALVGALSGEKASRVEPVARFKIVFTVYAVQPCDYDGLHIKELQDVLVEAGLLHGDAWDILDGEVRSRKAHTQAEEKTIIEISRL